MKIIPFEKMLPNEPYAFTLNVSNIPTNRTIQFRVAYYIGFLKKKFHHCKYVIYPELSSTGRLHYHGWIWFTTYRQIVKFNDQMWEISGDCDISIDTIDSQFGNVEWFRYVFKMKHMIKPYLLDCNTLYKLTSEMMESSQIIPANKGHLLFE